GLLLDLGAEADREALRDVELREPLLDRRHGVAERDAGVDLGVDAGDALLVLALNLRRTGLRRQVQHVGGRQYLTARRADEHLADRFGPHPIFLAQTHDDRELLAVLTEDGRLRAADVRPDG